jgi:hypothetical protein
MDTLVATIYYLFIKTSDFEKMFNFFKNKKMDHECTKLYQHQGL